MTGIGNIRLYPVFINKSQNNKQFIMTIKSDLK